MKKAKFDEIIKLLFFKSPLLSVVITYIIITSPLFGQEKQISPITYGSEKYVFEFIGVINKPWEAINKDIVKMSDLVNNELGFFPQLDKWKWTGNMNALIGVKITGNLMIGLSFGYGSGSVGNDELYRQIPFQIPQMGTLTVDINQHFKNRYNDKVLSLITIYYFRLGKRINPFIQLSLNHHWFESLLDLDFSITALNMNRMIDAKLNENTFGVTPIVGADIYITKNYFLFLQIGYPMFTIKGPSNVTDSTNGVIQKYNMDSEIKIDGFGLFLGFGYCFGKIF